MLLVIQSMGKGKRAKRNSPVVIKDKNQPKRQHGAQGDHYVPRRYPPAGTFATEKPVRQCNGHGKKKDQPLKRTAVCQDTCSQSQQHGVAETVFSQYSGISTDYQSGTQRCDRTAPIAVHPVAKNSELKKWQSCPQQSPLRREPALQHPQ